MTSFVSMNYWTNPKEEIGLFMDHIFSRLSFATYLLTGIFFISEPRMRIMVSINAILISACYKVSGYYAHYLFVKPSFAFT